MNFDRLVYFSPFILRCGVTKSSKGRKQEALVYRLHEKYFLITKCDNRLFKCSYCWNYITDKMLQL